MNALREIVLPSATALRQAIRIGHHDRARGNGDVPVSRTMNVGFYLFFGRGGIARYTHQILTALSQETGVNVELACDATYDAGAEPQYRIWPGLRSLAHPLPLLRRTRFITGQFANPARFCARANRRDLDLVHFSDFNHLSYPLWKKSIRDNGRKVVATVHDVRRAKSLFNSRYEDAQLRRFYRDADALFVHGEAQADELAQWAQVDRSRIHVVAFGPFDYGQPDEDRTALRARFGLPQDKQIALSFGNLRDDKNLDRLIRALPAYRKDVHLLVAGRAAARGHRPLEYYRQLCDELGVSDSVTVVTRYLSDVEVSEVFTACDWVALPYSRSFTSQSGVMGVAARYQRPVLASATPAFSEAMNGYDIGVPVDADDDDALVRGIGQMSEQLRRGHAFRFDDYLRANSWTANARRTLQVYRNLLSSH